MILIEDKLKKLNIVLPDPKAPVGAYVATKIVGNLLFISGQVSIDKSAKLIIGKIGKDLNLEEGYEAATRCGLSIVAHVKNACGGDLDRIKTCVKLTGYVNSTDDFKDQPKIINGASDIIAKIFDEKGEHTRAAVSVNSLPLGVAVEVDAIFEIN
jgi:enamine deaminase RidA (YjgF/YER057c/UK114 family)